jgi:hypothetical protein
MENEIMINNKLYKTIAIWRNNKIDISSKDYNNKLLVFPKKGKFWSGSEQFITKLQEVESILNKLGTIKIKCTDCHLCEEKCVTTKRYMLDNYVWDNCLRHYIKTHNYQPHNDFIEKIFYYDISQNVSLKLQGRIQNNNNITYLRLEKNQLIILDALMKHGGYNKKYYDKNNTSVVRNSEHAGYLEINNKMINNIVVSGNTMRVDRGDEEIFLPNENLETLEYEYVFHTHPPTPKPGGRAIYGSLFEFPSIGDMFHFIDHHNDGKAIGSLIMTPEGLYNIRKNIHNKKKINIDENDFFRTYQNKVRYYQDKAINKYGTNFDVYKFYSKIAQDTQYIEGINKAIERFNMHIDFFPRSKDFKQSWIVDTVYIPLYK